MRKKLALVCVATGITSSVIAHWLPWEVNVGLLIGAAAGNVYLSIAVKRELREIERLARWIEEEANRQIRMFRLN